jgi:hypothetical protein
MGHAPDGTSEPAGGPSPIRHGRRGLWQCGAAISDLIEATGRQVHSVRAALTGFRKDGKELIRAKDEGGVTRYRVAAEA